MLVAWFYFTRVLPVVDRSTQPTGERSRCKRTMVRQRFQRGLRNSGSLSIKNDQCRDAFNAVALDELHVAVEAPHFDVDDLIVAGENLRRRPSRGDTNHFATVVTPVSDKLEQDVLPPGPRTSEGRLDLAAKSVFTDGDKWVHWGSCRLRWIRRGGVDFTFIAPHEKKRNREAKRGQSVCQSSHPATIHNGPGGRSKAWT